MGSFKGSIILTKSFQVGFGVYMYCLHMYIYIYIHTHTASFLYFLKDPIRLYVCFAGV